MKHALIRPADLCRQLGIDKSTLYRWRRAGEFPQAVLLSPPGVHHRRIAFVVAEVEAWVEARDRGTAPAPPPSALATRKRKAAERAAKGKAPFLRRPEK